MTHKAIQLTDLEISEIAAEVDALESLELAMAADTTLPLHGEVINKESGTDE